METHCNGAVVGRTRTLNKTGNLDPLLTLVLLYQPSEIPVTPKAGRYALLGSDFLLKLTLLSLHSASSHTLLEAPSA